MPTESELDRKTFGPNQPKGRDPRLGRLAAVSAALIFMAFPVLGTVNRAFARNKFELHILLFLITLGTFISGIAIMRRSSMALAWISFSFCLLCWLWYVFAITTQNFPD
jgi:hypothetical protein